MMRIILIGGGETVYFLARQLKQKEHHVTIVNRNAAHCDLLFKQTDAIVINGEGSDQKSLEEAGARRADVVLALTPHDQDNLVACQIAQSIYGVPRVIALVNDPDNEEVFQKLGISHAFSSTRIIATMIEQQASFDDITQLMPVSEGKLHVSEIEINRDSPALGKPLLELGISDQTLIGCIIRGDEVIIPRGSNQLHVGDHILVISKVGDNKDIALLTGEQA